MRWRNSVLEVGEQGGGPQTTCLKCIVGQSDVASAVPVHVENCRVSADQVVEEAQVSSDDVSNREADCVAGGVVGAGLVLHGNECVVVDLDVSAFQIGQPHGVCTAFGGVNGDVIAEDANVVGTIVVAFDLNAVGPVDFAAVVFLIVAGVDGVDGVVEDLHAAVVGVNAAAVYWMA